MPLTDTGTQFAAENGKSERYLALLGVAKSTATNRNLSDLFQELAIQLKGLFDFRDIGILPHDDSRNVMIMVIQLAEKATVNQPCRFK